MSPDELLPLAEVARLLGNISEKSVKRIIARGQLPQPVRPVRKPMLPASEVSAYIEKLKNDRKDHAA